MTTMPGEDLERAGRLQKIAEANEEMLGIFARDLPDKLRDVTTQRHVANAAFFVREYLMQENPVRADQAMDRIPRFLGHYCIENVPGFSPDTLTFMAVSIRRFYRALAGAGWIPQNVYVQVREKIRAELPRWKEACEAYRRQDWAAWRSITAPENPAVSASREGDDDEVEDAREFFSLMWM